MAASAAHADSVLDGLQMKIGKVRRDVRQQIVCGVADLIQDLLRDARGCEDAAGVLRLRDGQGAVGGALGDGITDVVPAGNGLPVGKETSRYLRAALQQVAGETSCGEPVIVVLGPAELVHQNAERQGTVHAATGDDDVRALC
jgi:hypothetical protein